VNLSQPFISRPVATTLLTIGLALSGVFAFRLLPVAPLPQVDFPTISVTAALPGAAPETMATSVATPLERQLGRIAGVTEMTSTSTLGSTNIILQFDLNRNIDGAARDIQAAINAARSQLPANLPTNPNYRKVNPADAPVLILALTSDTMPKGRMYDAASTILQQKLSQISGVGQVFVGGSSLPAVRVELNPWALNKYGIGLEDVRTMLANSNANRPKGHLYDGEKRSDVWASDQLYGAEQYKPLIVTYRNGAPVRLTDVAEVNDAVEDLRNSGTANGKPAVLVIIYRQPAANIIDTVDRVREALPQLEASIPGAIKLSVVLDRTTTIRASLQDVEITLGISICLVILVVFVFLRRVRATLIPSVAVPVSLVGTFGVMYLCGYSLDNLSLMALTIATGFVVDDAIVVLENISRHIEAGMPRMEAALLGAREVGFTVMSMSLSLVAVFIPILLMGGMLGRLFREFAVVMSVAILISLVVSLTTTPMMCARVLDTGHDRPPGRFYRASEKVFDWLLDGYRRSLAWALRHSLVMLLVTIGTVVLNVYLFTLIPKGFFPDQDTGRLTGSSEGAQDISFGAMSEKLRALTAIVQTDPAVESVLGFSGGAGSGTTRNTGRVFISLKPLEERKVSATGVINRLRGKLSHVPGATLYLQPVQDVRIGGRRSNAQFQFTLEGESLKELSEWSRKILQELRQLPQLADVNSDEQNRGLMVQLAIDRATASRLGITQSMVDNTLYDAFGQRQVSTTYTQLNQYHVVMEVDPRYWKEPTALREIYVRSTTGAQVPLSAFASFSPSSSTLAVNHQGQFPAVTLSFNLMPGVSLGEAVTLIQSTFSRMGVPASVRGSFKGTAQAFQDSLSSQPLLILAAFLTVYIVLGILYESLIHPITILSTLFSAGVGALLALMLFDVELTVIAIIGLILLIGIVKKNAIMMIDFALVAEREHGKNSRDAIYEACLLRFRPILMTTMAALLGALPLALGTGVGSELRRPLGIAIVGGLIVSQALTLYTTPVVYLYLDRARLWFARVRGKPVPGEASRAGAA
jgi:multidrug efflux pump